MVTNPVIAYFAAAPVSTGELGKGYCTAFFRSNGADVEGHFRNFFGICSPCTADDREASGSREIRLQRLEGVNAYVALVEASVCDVGLFGVGKKGVAFLALVSAAL